MRRISREEEQSLFFFEAMLLIGLVLVFGGICVRIKEIIWTGGWLVVSSLIFFRFDVAGIGMLVLPGPFCYWYLQKLCLGKMIIILMIIYISVLVASIAVSIKLRKLRNEKESLRREHFVLRRLQRSTEG